MDERAVVQLWELQSFSRAALAALDLRVVFRGVPSDAGGPDYQDAILEEGRRSLRHGDVEFHVRSSDWYHHGHHLNPSYNHVILHVVWEHDGMEAVRADGVTVPVLALQGHARLQQPLLRRPCLHALSHLPLMEIQRRVERAGRLRFYERADRFTADLEVADPDQVAYCALLEAMGYASNRHSFRLLADAVPFIWIAGIPAEARLPALLDAARLGPPAPIPPPGHLPPDSWRLVRLRPANHPIKRLAGVAALLNRHLPHLASALVTATCSAARPAILRAALTAPGIGAGRADEIAASVVLPLCHALAPESEDALRLFERYPSPPATRWTRHMTDTLQRAGHEFTVRTALQHQGLHHVYHTWCRPERPDGCPVCGSL